jgi:phosphatidylglycerophosphate synthase
LILSAFGARILLRTRTARSSNAFGKSKMATQSIAVFLFLLAQILELETLTTVSLYLLWLALALAIVSGTMQIESVRKKQPPARP